jgi:transposase
MLFMKRTDAIKTLSKKFKMVSSHLNERTRRIWAATEAKMLGRGGVTIVSSSTGISRPTIYAGLKEIQSRKKRNPDEIRKSGGGRKKITEKDNSILKDLENLLEPSTRGDPESVLRWTCKSTKNLATEINKNGYRVSERKICDLLSDLGYSLQANKKTKEGASHPDRNKQFLYIYKKLKKLQRTNQPVISVDTKKKEIIGKYKNPGLVWRKKGTPEEVNAHDFPDKKIPKAAPYGVYDVARNEGWVSVGISHDTAEFAVATIKKWWNKMGKKRYSKAKLIYITADCGGSNGKKSRLWKAELQRFADQSGLDIHVSHFPPGTSKWNRIEHKMFSYISMNWRGRPLETYNVVVNLIANTKNNTGLEIRAELDENEYMKGIEISDEEFKSISLIESKFHGEWNYVIKTRKGKFL